ncbi:MAG TPA: MMPL family transporter [Thermoanaerobaculia bacterium]|jgi:hypothetical protein|nr:MMPL family transporter [Thermoanaerobaculia bacterium]
MSRLFDRLAVFVTRRPHLIFAISAITVVLAGATALRLRLDPDILKLVPQHNRVVSEFRRLLEETGTIDFHVIVVELPHGADPSTYEPLIDIIGEHFRRSPLVEQATWRLPDPLTLVERVLPYSMLLLTPQELDAVAAKLSDDGIRETVARNRALLQTPQSAVAKQIVRVDPFNLLPIYLEKFESSGKGVNADLTSGYYLSADRTTVILMVKPRRPAQDLPFSRELMAQSKAIANAALSEFRASHPTAVFANIGFTGGYAIAAGDEQIIRQDIILNVLTSVGGVLALFLYAFRRPAALAYSGLPMAAAIVVTFGIASLAYGTLSASSTGFAALLAGLGIDFVTVLYERYVDERNRGASVTQAVRIFMNRSLPAVVVAASTTAATFYGFLATDFRGMSELGLLTGSGILVFLLFVVFLFPALLVVVERRRGEKKRLHVHSFGSNQLVRASIRRPALTLAIWACVIAVAAIAARRVQFSDNIQNLRSKGNEGVRLQQVVTEKFGQSFDFMMYAVRGATATEAIEKTHAALPELDRFVTDETIGSYQSLASYVPSQEQQRAAIDSLRAGASHRFSVTRIERTFRKALREQGFRGEIWDDYLRMFRRALQPEQPMTMKTLDEIGLSQAAQRFIRKTPNGYVSIVYLYPRTKAWPRMLPEELEAFRAHHTEGVLTGINLVTQTLRTIVRNDAMRASLVGFTVVFLLLVIGFRSLTRAVLVFVPFLAGILCMLGAMATLGLEFNFMNVFIGLMLVGTATDYAVYMLQRYDESPDAFPVTASETARAVTLAALTSIVGFGSFAISHYPGLRSIGYAASFGVAASCLASVSLLPALLATGRFRRYSRRPH